MEGSEAVLVAGLQGKGGGARCRGEGRGGIGRGKAATKHFACSIQPPDPRPDPLPFSHLEQGLLTPGLPRGKQQFDEAGVSEVCRKVQGRETVIVLQEGTGVDL